MKQEKGKEIATSATPAELIKIAVTGGADLGQVEKLLEIQERYEGNEARKAFNKSMAEFKKNPPKIDKDKHVAYGNTKYNHASLANVVEKISAELGKYGLSASWRTKQNGQILVTCKITHELGHSEETTLSANADTSGSKNPIQAIGSAVSYLQRYTLLAITGLATYDMDDDAHNTTEKIDEGKLKIIVDLIKEKKVNEKKFLEYMKCETLYDISMNDFAKAKMALESKQTKKQVKNENN